MNKTQGWSTAKSQNWNQYPEDKTTRLYTHMLSPVEQCHINSIPQRIYVQKQLSIAGCYQKLGYPVKFTRWWVSKIGVSSLLKIED